MNADDRATPTSGLYTPQDTGASAEAPPVTAETPRRSAFRPVTTSAAPTAAPRAAAPTAPSNFQWANSPSVSPAATAPAAAPVTTPSGIPAAFTPPVTTPAAPSPTFAPATGTPAPDAASAGAFTVGAAKVKGFAIRAKDSLTEGDDLAASSKRGGPRKARVLISRVDPWSVLKIGFLLSIAIGIMSVVAVFVLWNSLNGLGLFELINSWIERLFDGQQAFNVKELLELNKVMSATILISVMNVVIITALSTIAAFLYNTVSSVVGGVYVTLTDD